MSIARLSIWSAPRTLSCRRRSGSGIGGKISHGPAYHVHPHLLDVGPSPDLLTMPKAIVENTPFAVFAGPDDREVFVLTSVVWGDDRARGVATARPAAIATRHRNSFMPAS